MSCVRSGKEAMAVVCRLRPYLSQPVALLLSSQLSLQVSDSALQQGQCWLGPLALLLLGQGCYPQHLNAAVQPCDLLLNRL